MFHFSLLRSARPFVFGNQRVWRNSAFVEDSLPWNRSLPMPSCSHSMAHEMDHLMPTQAEDLGTSTKWVNKATIRLGTFNLLAPCYKTIEARYE